MIDPALGEALEAATRAYYFGVFPGDESEATHDELRPMALRVVSAFVEYLDEHYVGDMDYERGIGYLCGDLRVLAEKPSGSGL